MAVKTEKETLSFQAEVKQLLQLMIHSLYSNKEIFLRELISNASDACDKLRFEALTNDKLMESESELKIRVDFDKEAKTVTISDNGIGMNRQEVMDNIGTIANSGTKKFLENLSGDQAKDAQMIGQFGVGFYSTFIIADKVDLHTRRAGEDAEQGILWSSSGEGEYALENVSKDECGTTITMHLKEDEGEFLEAIRLRNIINKYSEHISLPIEMVKEIPPSTDDEKKDEDETVVEEYEAVNKGSALWSRGKSEIKDDEYKEFYKTVSHDFDEPLSWLHNHVEGTQSYISLFYIPKKAPFDLYERDARRGIKLYVKRVFILDDSEQLMPSYLRFVRGVVDSADLPLNVSREILQKNKSIDSIRSASVKRILSMLDKMSKNDKEDYAVFWTEFGQVLKEGMAEDFANKDKIAKLLRFATTNSDSSTENTSLDEYIERMKEGQDKIYYITGDSYKSIKNSPHLEMFKKKGIEVVLMPNRVDEWMMSYLNEYEGKAFVSVAKGEMDLGDLHDEEEKKQVEEVSKDFEALIGTMTAALGDKVKEVRISSRLTDSPSCLVVEQDDMAVSMQRLLQQAGHEVPTVQPILEINPTHSMIAKLKDISSDELLSEWANILFDQAMLSEGGQLEDPVAYVRRINNLLSTMS